jgi:membrane protein YdbS with pleckstrin-like domain
VTIPPRAQRISKPRRQLTPLRILFHTVGLVAIMAFAYFAMQPPRDLVMMGVAILVMILVGVDIIAGSLENNGWSIRRPSND